MKVTLKTIHDFKYGQKNVLPIVGEVQISDGGTIEVTAEEAEQIEAMEIGWYVEKVDTSTTTTTTKKPEQTTTTTTELVTTTTTVEETTTTTTEQLQEKAQLNEPLEGEVAEETTTTTTLSERDQLLAEIDGMLLPDLQKQAAAFPKSEWTGMNKPALKAYLKSKLA